MEVSPSKYRLELANTLISQLCAALKSSAEAWKYSQIISNAEKFTGVNQPAEDKGLPF